jgi:hypothetical protein
MAQTRARLPDKQVVSNMNDLSMSTVYLSRWRATSGTCRSHSTLQFPNCTWTWT